MAITRHNRPVFNLTCDTCGQTADHDGMPIRFDSRDSAANYAHDFGWDGPWCLNPGEPAHCPDCAARKAEKEAREKSDQEHHEAEIAAAIRYALTDHA